MTRVLLAAAAYNVLWGAWVIAFPNALFTLLSVDPPSYPAIWQCVGMIVGVYGVGYAIAAFHPLRHWPIVLVGLLGKVLGPMGYVDAALIRGTFPIEFGWTIITNDLMWWIPFGLILQASWRAYRLERGAPPPISMSEALRRARTHQGETLHDLSMRGPLLMVFLRHTGCTFCREALADISARRGVIASRGVTPVLVHMGPADGSEEVFSAYALADLPRVSDPERTLYRAFGLARGSFGQLFGLKCWIRGVRAGLLDRHGVGRLVGDGFQMPGVFLVQQGAVVQAYRHRSAADRPDYASIASCPAP